MLEFSVDNTSPLQRQQIVADDTKLQSAVTDLGIRDNTRNWGYVCSTIGSSIPTASELDVYQTAATPDLHVFATLRPTEAELGQPCISTLLPFEDRTVPVLDEVARDIIPTQLYPDPLPSRENVVSSRRECTMVSGGGGSEDDDESGDSEEREPLRRPEVIRVETVMERPRTRGTVGTVRTTTLVHRRLGHISLPPCTDVLLSFMHPPHLMYDKVKPLVRASRETRWRNYCSIKERSSKFACAQ
ncbi:Hypothetical predicted protein [Olea europaea subsp. europaea]|uniref:Uncharacterized protein n=1 Tax=Olea europaea subsp. europaea TaxID=158383 RepID=A0A8S0UBN5_OLEEU|nr:Hypothetical predicted protein [Olea europaea subsp. europaea]